MSYQETVRSPWWTYATAYGLSVIFCFTVASISGPLALALLVLMIGGSTWVIEKRNLRLTVDDTSFHVGPDAVPRADITSVQPLDAEQMRDMAGPDADARATLVLRNLGAKSGVKVEVTSGKAPYWLVSSNHPEELASALTSS